MGALAQFLDGWATRCIVAFIHFRQKTNVLNRACPFEPGDRALTAFERAGLAIPGNQASSCWRE